MFFWSSGTAASKHAEINRDRKKSYLENEKYSLGSSKVSFKDIFMNDQTGMIKQDLNSPFFGQECKSIIITRARLQPAEGELDAVNRLRFLYIYRALGYLS